MFLLAVTESQQKVPSSLHKCSTQLDLWSFWDCRGCFVIWWLWLFLRPSRVQINRWGGDTQHGICTCEEACCWSQAAKNPDGILGCIAGTIVSTSHENKISTLFCTSPLSSGDLCPVESVTVLKTTWANWNEFWGGQQRWSALWKTKSMRKCCRCQVGPAWRRNNRRGRCLARSTESLFSPPS